MASKVLLVNGQPKFEIDDETTLADAASYYRQKFEGLTREVPDLSVQTMQEHNEL
jgi:hypothetical protein